LPGFGRNCADATEVPAMISAIATSKVFFIIPLGAVLGFRALVAVVRFD
jgi:hypothetical protein